MLLVLNHQINHGSKQNKIAIIKQRHGGGSTRRLKNDEELKNSTDIQLSGYTARSRPQAKDRSRTKILTTEMLIITQDNREE